MKLSQILVGEVSLVDKAANKRKYLLYKRDDSAKPEDILKTAGEAFDALIGLMKAKDDGAPNEIPKYAQQAKDLLSNRWPQLVSYYTDEEKSALAKPLAKADPPPPDPAAKKDDEVEFTPEELAQLESIDKAVTSLQQQLAEGKK